LSSVANSVSNVSPSARLDHGCNNYHNKYQSSRQSKEMEDAPKRRSKSSSEVYGKPTRRVEDKSRTRREKHCWDVFLLMDELAKFRRAKSFVRRFPNRVSFEFLLTATDEKLWIPRKDS
jgi:hypothetical protein